MPVAYLQGNIRNNPVPREPVAAKSDGTFPASPGHPAPGAAPAAPAQPAPRFDIIAERPNDRHDRAITYYAVVERINTGDEAFKSEIKRVLEALAAHNGGPVFSASIWDNLPAAQTEVSYRSNPDLFTEDLLNARDRFNHRHLAAKYVGGLSAPDERPSFILIWFPEASPADLEVANWTSAEVWKP